MPNSQAQKQHGGQIYQFARHQKLPPFSALTSVLDFSASINPMQPQVDWPVIQKNAQMALVHYPDSQQVALKSALAHRFQLDAEQITLTNGISSAIMSLFAEIQPDKTLLLTPIYSEYQRAAERYSQEVIEIDQSTVDSMMDSMSHSMASSKISADHRATANQTAPEVSAALRAFNALTQHSILVLVNPNTPQGDYRSPAQLRHCLELAHQKQAWVLVDESFLPFIGFDDAYSVRAQLKIQPKLIVLQSLTKYYACPGARIGALFSAANTLESLAWPSWPVSVFDEHYLLQALADQKHDTRTQRFLTQARASFIEALLACDLVESVHPTSANFLLVTTVIKASELVEQLAHKNILIRDCDSFGLGAYRCRIAIKSVNDNQSLITALQSITSANNSPLAPQPPLLSKKEATL